MEFMLIDNKCHPNKFDSRLPIEVFGDSINSAGHAPNLRVSFDADFIFQRHINNTVESCNYYIIMKICRAAYIYYFGEVTMDLRPTNYSEKI